MALVESSIWRVCARGACVKHSFGKEASLPPACSFCFVFFGRELQIALVEPAA